MYVRVCVDAFRCQQRAPDPLELEFRGGWVSLLETEALILNHLFSPHLISPSLLFPFSFRQGLVYPRLAVSTLCSQG